jgi:hypothetical protein
MPTTDRAASLPAPPAALSRPARLARRAAVATAVVLCLALAGQFLTAGAAVFVNPEWWVLHAAAVHWFDWLTPVAVVLGFLGRMSGRVKALSGIIVALVLVQYVTAGLRGSPVLGGGAALHPLGGFILFWTVTELLRRAWAEARA